MIIFVNYDFFSITKNTGYQKGRVFVLTLILTFDCSGDGVANPFEICLALSNEAMDKGVTVVEGCQVKRAQNFY